MVGNTSINLGKNMPEDIEEAMSISTSRVSCIILKTTCTDALSFLTLIHIHTLSLFLMSSADFIYGNWFKYELEWEMVSKSNNVLVLIYEEMKTVRILNTSYITRFLKYSIVVQSRVILNFYWF